MGPGLSNASNAYRLLSSHLRWSQTLVVVWDEWASTLNGDDRRLSISATEHGNGLIIETGVAQLRGRSESFLKKLRSTTP